jgi:hypothetical protein
VPYSEDFGFSTERSFFGSNHGKNPCDGLRAVIKKAAKDAVISREATIQSAYKMYEYLEKIFTIAPPKNHLLCRDR